MFAIGLIVAATTGAAGMYALHRVQVGRSAETLRRRADTLLEEGKHEEAAPYLRQIAGLDPDDVETLLEWARTLEELADAAEESARTVESAVAAQQQRLAAFKAFEDALLRDPALADERRKQVERALRLGLASPARGHLNILPKPSSSDGELLYLSGQCYQLEGKPEQAADDYRAALDANYREPKVYASLAAVLETLKEPEKARQTIEEMIAANPGSGIAYLMRARSRMESGELPGATSDLQKALELASGDLDLHLAAAALVQFWEQIDPADVERVRAGLEQLVEANAADTRVYYRLALLDRRLGEPARAEEWLRRGMKSAPADFGLRTELASLLIDEGRPDEARQELQQLSKADVPLAYARDEVRFGQLRTGVRLLLEGSLLLQERQWAAARWKFQQAQPALLDQRELAERTDRQLALCYRQLRDHDAEIEAWRRAVKRTPASSIAHAGLAEALSLAGKFEEALEHHRQALDGKPATATTVELLLKRNLVQPATARNWEEVRLALEEALANAPEAPELIVLQASLLQVQGRPSEAQKLLEDARTADPDESRYWSAAADLLRQAQDWTRAEAVLDEAQARFGDTAELRTVRILHWTARGGDVAATALAKLEQGLDRFPADAQARVLAQLAQAQRAAGRPDEALRLWRAASDLVPTDLEVQMHYFDAALEGRDELQIRDAAERLRDVDGTDGPYARLARVAELTLQITAEDSPAREEADAILNKLESERPDWPLVWVHRARFDELRLNVNADRVVEDYRKVLGLGRRNPAVVQRLVAVLNRQQQWKQADETVRHYEDVPGLFASALFCRLASRAALGVEDRARAVTLAERAIAADRQDPANHLWLARLQADAGEMTSAEASGRAALQLDPTSGDAWAVLVQVLVRSERREAAVAAVGEAAQHLTSGRSRLALALCYQAIGDNTAAEKEYAAALSENPEDALVVKSVAAYWMRTGQYARAEAQFRTLIGMSGSLSQADRRWAHSSLAVVLAGQDYEHFLAALDHLDERISAGSAAETRLERLLKARLLATRPDRSSRDEAVRLMREVDQEEPLQPADYRVLAGLYDATGRRTESEAAWNVLLTSHGRDATTVASYIDRCLRQKQLERAEEWLPRLEELQPGAAVGAQLAIRLHAAQGEAERAIARVQHFVTMQNSAVPDEALRLSQAAGWLDAAVEELQRDDPARRELLLHIERLYRDLAARHPESVLVLAAFLGRQGRTDEALNLCEESIRSVPVLRATATGIGVLRGTSPTTSQIARVEGWLQKLPVSAENGLSVLIQIADLRFLRQRYPEAAGLYERILQQDPNNIVALNNLAWLVSSQKQEHDRALALLASAEKQTGPVEAILDTRGTILTNAGRLQAAVDSFEDALEQRDSPATRFRLAVAQWRLGERAEAATNLQRAIADGLAESDLEPSERPLFGQMRETLARAG